MTLTMPLFVIASAGFYAVAMIAMKFWGQAPSYAIGLLIALMLLGGAWTEIEALKSERLGLIYVGILGAEVILIAAASWFLFGENFSTRELAGAAFILVGTALAWA
ncbi:hypothetical protein KHP62_00415 [Rhodobacteraceae bacterium NNCM2]|nr:hypothetical protein [Coraliihabitans acroporae]